MFITLDFRSQRVDCPGGWARSWGRSVVRGDQAGPAHVVLAALERVGSAPRRSGTGWRSRCPAHDDHVPSLSISAGHDDRVLLYCHFGCSAEQIVAALGLQMTDLFVTAPSTPPPATARQVVAAYPYRDESGQLLFEVVREEPKSFRQRRPDPTGGWIWKLDGVRRVPYRLPELSAGPAESPVYIVEGEKDADRLAAAGKIATTNPGGAGKWRREFGEHFLGRRVVILPDNDSPGISHGDAVARALVGHAAEVRVLLLPGLPEKGDVSDWLDAGGRPEELERLIEAAPRWEPGPSKQTGSTPHKVGAETKRKSLSEKSEVSAPKVLSWRAFPVDALPPGCRLFATEEAAARGLDVAHLGPAMLAALAGAIGNARRLRVKASYSEPAVLWCVTVARSGVGKSSGLDDVLRPHREEERRLADENKAALERHRDALTRHEGHCADYRSARKKHPNVAAPAGPPDPPPHRVLLVEDITVEALAERLGDNPRGVLLACDELSGWVASFDAYKSARGADVAHYLSMHRAGPLTVDRKDRRRPRLQVPRAAVSVLGTIQPRTLARVIRSEHRENGLLARLFVTMPRESVPRWSETDVSPAAYGAWETVIETLLHVLDDEQELLLTPEARVRWRSYHDDVAQKAADEDDDLYAALAKLRGGALRIALVLALARAAEQGLASDLTEVDLEAMSGGIALASWFAHEARRVYAALSETPEEHEARLLLDWIESRGGRVAPHELARSGPRRFRGSSEDAEKLLRHLAASGLGAMVEHPPGPSGGRPATEFVRAPRGAETPEFSPDFVGSDSAPEMGVVETQNGDPDPERDEGETGDFLRGDGARP